MAEPRRAPACGTSRSRSSSRRSPSSSTWMMKASGPPMCERGPSPAAGVIWGVLHVCAQRLGPSSLPSSQWGEVAPSLHHCPSLRCRIRLDPHPSTPESRVLPAPTWALPQCLRVSEAASVLVPSVAWMRGHLLQPHNSPSKTKPGGSIRRSRRCEGERGLSCVWDKTCFFSSFVLLILPVQGHTAASLGEQLCTLPDWCSNISVGF